jgi:transformation/transcription domain-associated protein
VYRTICMLISHAIQVWLCTWQIVFLTSYTQTYVIRINAPDDDGLLTADTIANLTRMAVNMAPFVKACFLSSPQNVLECWQPSQREFEDEFITSKPTHYEYIQRLQQWRDRFETILDSRPRLQPLAVLSHYLTEFQYSKVDEIEIPGQYTEVCLWIVYVYHILIFL